MNIKPILFSAEEARATLDERKTTKRLVVKQRHVDKFVLDVDGRLLGSFDGVDSYPMVDDCPYQYGDILYVRETWTKLYYVDPNGYTHYDQPMYYYAADGEPDITLIDPDGFEEDDQRIRWRPSIHMPKEAARMWLRVTDVRVERLQDCGNAQAKDEGCTCCSQFARIWDSTIKPSDRERYGWAANPWVWVIEFERCEKPEE